MTGSDFWISYGLPAFGVAFGLGGLAVLWLSARRFDARFASVEAPPPPAPRPPRAPRVTLYRRPGKRQGRGAPSYPAALRS